MKRSSPVLSHQTLRRLLLRLPVLACVLTLSFLLQRASAALPGELDTTFGTRSGYSLAGFTSGGDAGGVAIQADGRIVVAGKTYSQTHVYWSLARFHPDGAPDSGFGQGGTLTTPLPNDSDGSGYADALIIQRDGKILAAGTGAPGFTLVRYHPDGSLDDAFGSNGIVTTSMGEYSSAYTIAVQEDGKILAGGYAFGPLGQKGFAVVRYHENGSLDTSFNGTGIQILYLGTYVSDCQQLIIQPDRKIIAIGQAAERVPFGSPTYRFATVRLEADGSPDPAFGDRGVVFTAFGNTFALATCGTLAPDGGIVIAGSTTSPAGPGEQDLAMARLTSSGSLDPSFGTHDGKLTINLSPMENVVALAAQDDGSVMAAIQVLRDGMSRIVLGRLLSDGAFDTTFNQTGYAEHIIGLSSYPRGMQLLPDGKILVAGTANFDTTTNSRIAVARFWGGPPFSLTLAADEGGVVTGEGVFTQNTVTTILAVPDQGYAFAGWSGDASGTDNPLSVTMNSHKRIAARFIKRHTLTLGADSRGTVSGIAADGRYAHASTVALRAEPASGYAFVGWAGDVVSTSNPLEFPILKDTTVIPLYARALSPSLRLSDPLGRTIAPGSALSFGHAAPGSAIRKRLTLLNQGADEISGIRIDMDGATPVEYAVQAGTLPFALAPGESRSFSVSFTPQTSGRKSVAIHITAQSLPGQSLSLTASGVGDSQFILHPQDARVDAGSPLELQALASLFDGTDPSYQWFRNGVPLSGKNGSRLEISALQPWHQGEYTVQVAALNGALRSRTAVVRLRDSAFGPWQDTISCYGFDSDPSDRCRPSRDAELVGDVRFIDDDQRGGVVELIGKGFATPAFDWEPVDSRGPGGFIRIPRPLAGRGSSFTISLWIKERAYSHWHGESFLTLGHGPDSRQLLGHYWLGGREGQPDHYGNGSAVVESLPPGSAAVDAAGKAVLNGDWTHWAVVAENQVMKIYKQGQFLGEMPYPEGAADDDLYLGRHWWIEGGLRYSARLTARMDDLRCYDRALSSSQIAQLFFATKTPPPPSVFSSWLSGHGLSGGPGLFTEDADDDSLTHIEEFVFGTDPRVPTPAPFHFSVGPESSVLSWLGRSQVRYLASVSNDLRKWTPSPFGMVMALDQEGVPTDYHRYQLELPLLEPGLGIPLYATRIEALSAPLFASSQPLKVQPAPAEASPGSSASLELSDLPYPPPSGYQWFRDGSPIPSATSSRLELTDVKGSDSAVYHVVATNDAGSTMANQVHFQVLEASPPSVVTGDAYAISHESALLHGIVASKRGGTLTDCGIVYGLHPLPDIDSGILVSAPLETGAFTVPLGDLKPGSTYYFRSFAANEAGIAYGLESRFQTPGFVPSVGPLTVSPAGAPGSVVAEASVLGDNGAPVTVRGVVYGVRIDPRLEAESAISVDGGVGAFHVTIEALAPGAHYYFRAFATNAMGTAYGPTASMVVRTPPQ